MLLIGLKRSNHEDFQVFYHQHRWCYKSLFCDSVEKSFCKKHFYRLKWLFSRNLVLSRTVTLFGQCSHCFFFVSLQGPPGSPGIPGAAGKPGNPGDSGSPVSVLALSSIWVLMGFCTTSTFLFFFLPVFRALPVPRETKEREWVHPKYVRSLIRRCYTARKHPPLQAI